jgi:hypothetical protein
MQELNSEQNKAGTQGNVCHFLQKSVVKNKNDMISLDTSNIRYVTGHFKTSQPGSNQNRPL